MYFNINQLSSFYLNNCFYCMTVPTYFLHDV